MYLRPNRRFKDGKEHRYWSIVESKRCAGGKVVQRQVLYLGEINDSQQEAWCRVIEAFDERRNKRHCHGAPGLWRSRSPVSPTRMNKISYSGYRFPPEIIQQGSSLNGVGKAVFWVRLGSDRLGSSLL